MASFTYRKGRWRASVRRVGTPSISRTFTLKSDAESWARNLEIKIEGGGNTNFRELGRVTVKDVFQKFVEEVTPNRKGEKFERTRLTAFMRCSWARLHLDDNIHLALIAWRDQRLQEVSKATVVRELGLISSVFNHAMQEWALPMAGNPGLMVKRPSGANVERDRLWSEGDLKIWMDHFNWSLEHVPSNSREMVPWLLQIARKTGLRLGEICRIRVADIDLSVPAIHFSTTKNGDAYDCPLRKDAVELLRTLLTHRQGEEYLIGATAEVMGEFYRRERKEIAKLHPSHKDLVVHSLRHTYTTEMVARVPDKMALLRITGRRSMQSLVRYYKPTAGDLAELMG